MPPPAAAAPRYAAGLPEPIASYSNAPTRAEWSRAARTWQARIDAKIADLQRMSETLTSCIGCGCGCLWLRRCSLYNPADTAAQLGAGARWLLGDVSSAEASQSG